MTVPPDAGGLEGLFEDAPCGYIIARPDRRVVKVNTTLLTLLGYERDALIDRPFTDFFTAGGRIHYETHFDPLLRLHGQLAGVTVDLVTARQERLPVFLSANVKRDAAGEQDLLRLTVLDARGRRSYERELLDERQRAEQERAHVQTLATTLQRSLLPPSLYPPDGLEAAALYHAASSDDVSGDFYDLFPLAHDKWGFFLGDVAGKGAQAATVTSLTRYTLRAAAVFDDDPIAVLHNVDSVLKQSSADDSPQMCTLIFGVLTPNAGGYDIRMASGGHPPPLLLPARGQAQYVDTVGGMPIGIVTKARFVSTRIVLSAGDTLVLYSDGLTEARIGAGVERYDDDGALLRFAAQHCPTTAPAVVDDIRSLLDELGSGVEDDAAVLALGAPLTT
ncbi:MAG: phosphoserine phosphatase RsbU/P [Mycobacterium sp.]|jgi:sigma-B regulation protein RsbU (phosphoserine phosphatase)|nr:phosphoserine phosphatase RsbU/P [Mycobacterium sp.]